MNVMNDAKDITGVLLLDKPFAATSNRVLQNVKGMYNARKAGHTGSLDPLATGMLPICFGEATKFAHFLLDSDKSYRLIAKLGIKTTTGDAEGEIIDEKPVPQFDDEKIECVLQKFRGDIEQLPSMYSAIKYKGRPLYKFARKGETVERKRRPVKIHVLKVLNRSADKLELEVHASKGTYVRTLVEDIGEELNCGAYVISLRRLTVGHYQAKQMYTFAALEQLARQGDHATLQAQLLPIESMFHDWETIQITDPLAFYLRQGQSIMVSHSAVPGWVQLRSENERFLGIGEILPSGKVAPRRLTKF